MPARLVAERYELRELLGEGGMGFVYRAVDTRTGGLVAIKTMRDTSDSRSLELFKKEWKVLSRLTHPNIVDIRDVDEIEEDGIRKPCFIMPLLSGVTLAQLIKGSSSRLTVTRVVGIISQVCNGLEAAHKIGLIHRDLKPSNIFVMEDDTAKLIDFGLVHDAGVNSFAGFKGTFPYASPEQLDDKPLTPESDIYSLGVVAYEALTGRSPFKRPTNEATREAVRTHIPPSVSELNSKVSQLVSKVIHKAMAKQPVHRYSSAKEFGETLHKAYRNEPIERFDPARILPRIERARKAFKRDDGAFASEILSELEAEGNVDPEITLLRAQIEEALKQKRVRQLFEAAQSRLEQDEIPLALDKIREILEIDPENNEALSVRKRIEEQRSNEQISKWMELARRHIETHDFQEARQAVQEILNLRYDDSDALHLLSDIDAQEKEATNARQEKEQLYGSALRAYQGGEISSALSKLERILDVSRRAPGATVPERDAVYQSFYNQVRSERDSIDKAYEDGRKYLNDKDFTKALEICNQMLERYPSSAQFQALKLKIEQSERQELSSYIAQIARAVDGEPDLNRRVGILEEASRRYPNEQQFQQSLRLAREQRDLVNSILAKARQYEEQNQFADAIGQWKILRNIHPQYPGMEFEIAQLEKRREQYSAEEKKIRLVEQIDRAIANGAYPKAAEIAGYALTEFPQDQELVVLERIARQGLERTREAESLFEHARKARAERRYEQAIDLLKDALQLDEHNGGIRSALVSLLVERAHTLLDDDWRKAEPLVEAAAELDSNHPAVKRLRTLVDASRRKNAVTQFVADARNMQLTGNVRGALDLVGDGLSHYPDDARLRQIQAKLKDTLTQPKQPTPLADTKPLASPVISESDGIGLSNPFARSTMEPNSFASGANSIAEETMPTPGVAQTAPKDEQTAESENGAAPPVVTSNNSKIAWLAAIEPKKLTIFGCSLAAAVLAAGFGVYYSGHRKPTNVARTSAPRAASPHSVSVPITLSPPDATLTVNGEVRTDRKLTLDRNARYYLGASRLGYVSQMRSSAAPDGNGWTFQLAPEPLRLQVVSGEHSGKLLLDGNGIWDLQQGDLNGYEVPADNQRHTLTGRNQNGEFFKVDFQASTAALPQIAPFTARNLLVGTSLGSQGAMYGAAGATVSLTGQTPQPITPGGTAINLAGSDADQALLAVSDGRRTQNFGLVHGNAPSLSVLLSENPNVGSLVLDTSVPDAQLFVDGQERRESKPGHWRISGLKPGPHEVRVMARNFIDQDLNVQIEKGKETKQSIEFTLATAYLVIKDGPAGAEVLVDGANVATLDGDGNLRKSLAPTTHSIELRHEGYESLSLNKPFIAGQSVEIPGRDLVRAFGALSFDISPSNATVTYRLEGGGESRPGSTSGAVKVKQGTYEVFAEADKYVASSVSVPVEPSVTAPAHLKLILAKITDIPPVNPFQNPSDVHADNGWFTGLAKVVALKSAAGYTLSFLKPDRVPLKHKNKKIEWRIALYPDAEIVYELDGQQLTRSVKRISVTEPKSAIKVQAWNADQALVRITLQEHRIVVSTGGAKDEFTDPDHNWSRASISLRGDQYFTVSPLR